MAVFEIDGTEYELKITGKSIKAIDKRYEGGTMMFLSAAMQGSLDTFTDVVYYGLKHTEDGITRKKVEQEIENKLEKEELSLSDMYKIIKEVIIDSFFFKEMIDKMTEADPTTKAQMEAIMK